MFKDENNIIVGLTTYDTCYGDRVYLIHSSSDKLLLESMIDIVTKDEGVNREHENESEQVVELVASTVDNWTDYDVVFIGYPIWWGNAAWPVNGFIETNDFTGKTVIPFCTSSSSELGESGELLEEMAGTGDWQEGQRFRSSASEDDVRTWVEGLGF